MVETPTYLYLSSSSENGDGTVRKAKFVVKLEWARIPKNLVVYQREVSNWLDTAFKIKPFPKMSVDDLDGYRYFIATEEETKDAR